jgi:hypothetical protein
MWTRFKRGGILLLAVCGLMFIEGLAIGEPLAVAQNTNSGATVQNSNSGPSTSKRRTSRRRGRRGRRGGRG